MVGISLQLSGVESHNSLRSGERYHDPLRRIFRKIKFDAPSVEDDDALRLAFNAMNNTLGPEGLTSSLLVFGTQPRFPPLNTALPKQSERMAALRNARAEMATITAELRVRKALMSKIPTAASYVINPGEQVWVYRETDKRYIGPHPVIRVEDKQVFILVGNKEVQHSIHQVIPDQDFQKLTNETCFMDIPHSAMIQFKSNHRLHKRDTQEVLIQEIIHPSDPRSRSPDANAARKKEIDGLVRKGTWKVVIKEEVPPDANVLNGRFFITIKDIETNEPIHKARYVVQGHKDKEKNRLVHNSTTVRQSSTRVLTALAAVFGLRVWSHGITQAYLQSASKLMRDVYLKPSKEFELSSDQLVKLLKPLYGLADSGGYWNVTMAKHREDDLGLKHTAGDMSLFLRKFVAGFLVSLVRMWMTASWLEVLSS